MMYKTNGTNLLSYPARHMYLGTHIALLLTDLRLFKLTETKAWISNHIHCFLWNVITHPSLNFNGNLAKPPLKLGHGSIIISHDFILI